MIPKSERDKHRSILAAATPLPWRWWTSNSMRRLSSDPTGKDGDVAHAFVAADGVPDIAIHEADMMAIETGVNAIGRYIADAEETERRIAEVERLADEAAAEALKAAGGRARATAWAWKQRENTLRFALRILRGET